MLWHCGSEGTVCCWTNTTPWKQNGISSQSVCCLFDCDLLWCWINRWIRLWNEMIGWIYRLFLLSSDNLSVGEESCESANPWILDPISFVVISIILSTGDMEWPSWLLLFLPSLQKAIPIQSIFSNTSTKLIPFHHIETAAIESISLDTLFYSHHVVTHNSQNVRTEAITLILLAFILPLHSLSVFYPHYRYSSSHWEHCMSPFSASSSAQQLEYPLLYPLLIFRPFEIAWEIG